MIKVKDKQVKWMSLSLISEGTSVIFKALIYSPKGITWGKNKMEMVLIGSAQLKDGKAVWTWSWRLQYFNLS
jgi:hypothetical protein